jgi:protoporphyrinogen IX oxidase
MAGPESGPESGPKRSPDVRAGHAVASDASAARRAGIVVAITVAITALAAWWFGARAYDWIKAVHVIAVISWMAGLLYLPRLFIYHCTAPLGSVQSETFKVMERRLVTIIMTPAMAITWVLGLWLAWTSGFYATTWFHVKFAAVLALTAAHEYLASAMRRFEEDGNTKSAAHWRVVNEIPAVLMVLIVILAIVKPF